MEVGKGKPLVRISQNHRNSQRKKNQKRNHRLLRLLVLRTDLKEQSLAALLGDGNLLTQVGPFCSPMWVHFSRRLPIVPGGAVSFRYEDGTDKTIKPPEATTIAAAK